MAALTQSLTGQVSDQAMWIQCVDDFLHGHVYDAVAGYGADPTGATDSTAAINNAVSACSTAGGGVVWVPPGAYSLTRRHGAVDNQDGGIRLLPGVSLLGYGATLRMDGNAAHIYTSGPTTQVNTQATVSAAVTAGTSTILVASSMGFAAGDEVFCRFGENPADTPETSYGLYAKVAAVPDDTHITLDCPLSLAFDPAPVTNAQNKTITKLVNQVTGVLIAGFTFTQGAPGNVEYPILLDHCRNISIRDIRATNPGAGLTVYYSERVLIDSYCVDGSIQQLGQSSKGRALGVAGSRNVTASKLRFRGCAGIPMLAENYSRNVRVEDVKVEVTSGIWSSNTGVFTASQFCDLTVKNCHLSGDGTHALLFNDASSNNLIQTEDLVLTTTPQVVLGPLMSKHSGALRVKGGPTAFPGDWSKQDTVTLTINLVNSMTGAKFAIPDGLNMSVNAYISSKTGVVGVYLTTGGGDSADWTSNLAAGRWVELGVNQALNQLGSGNVAFGPSARSISVYTTTVTAGATLVVAVTYLHA